MTSIVSLLFLMLQFTYKYVYASDYLCDGALIDNPLLILCLIYIECVSLIRVELLF